MHNDDDATANAFLAGAADGSLATVAMLLDDVDVDAAMDDDGSGALHLAAAAGHVQVVDFLVPRIADTSRRNKSGHTPLGLAVTHGHLYCVDALLRHDVNPRALDGSRRSPLWLAAHHGHMEIASALLAVGVRVDIISWAKCTPLCAIALSETPNFDLLRLLLAQHPNPDTVAAGLATTVSFSPHGGPIAQLYIDAGLTSSLAVLCEFLSYRRLDGAMYIAATIDWAEERDAFTSKAGHGDRATLCRHLASGDPLMTAIRHDMPDAVAVLAPLTDVSKWDYLHIAVDDARMVTSLVAAGCNPNLLDTRGRSALHCAIVSGALESVRILAPITKDAARYRHNGQSLLALALASPARHRQDIIAYLAESILHATHLVPTSVFFWQPTANTVLGSPKTVAYAASELAYMHALCFLLDAPSWPRRLATADIRAAQRRVSIDGQRLLRFEVELRRAACLVAGHVPNTAFGVYHTTTSLAPTLARFLEPLEPRSAGNGIREIIDPNLHCIVHGLTRFDREPHCGRLCVPKYIANGTSSRFQWLPTTIDVDAGRVTHRAYFNNIPSRHTRLLAALHQLIQELRPLWQLSMTANDTDHIPQIRIPVSAPTPVLPPTLPRDFFTLQSAQLETASTLQVVVQAQALVVSSTSPTHHGLSWQANGSGCTSDGIVATGLVVYAADHVKALPKLRFRQSFTQRAWVPDPSNPTTEVPWHERHWFGYQETGFVTLHVGRLVTIPTCVDYCLSPFELEKSASSGALRLLRVYLVQKEARKRLLSTEFVPPPYEALPQLPLPEPVVDIIWAFVGIPPRISTAQAHVWANQARAERLGTLQ
ncbi:hypothetical protein, variant [Saprolegnia diclina VS20]|uniref:DUF4246 domain-containing protein n=1 Tax=Saprolegnia diclina (strain VS20) TaxID=1156394 RepID=T0QNB6_SAPDV|nr:hypothetical protein, variant [Saprolegnia diclina VS20]EQC39569.1 hypothetical protein, variant [Saprolegnia diclina VS20]|eukprot:XP_008606841.1 hypothetical protein, variant [Saprolegnia diclina VS20]